MKMELILNISYYFQPFSTSFFLTIKDNYVFLVW